MPKLINTGRSFRITLNRIIDERLSRVCKIKKWNDREFIELVIMEGVDKYEKAILEAARLQNPNATMEDLAEMDPSKLREIVHDSKKKKS